MELHRTLDIAELQRLNKAFASKERQFAQELAALREAHANETADAANREQNLRATLEQGFRAALEQVQRDTALSAAELTRAQAEREGALQSELATLREIHANETADAAKREQDLRNALAQVQRDAAELSRAQGEREAALQGELSTLREAHANETTGAAKREQGLQTTLAQVQRDAAELSHAQGEREAVLQGELSTLREAHVNETADAAKRERDLRAALAQMQRDAVELARAQEEREAALQSELATLREAHENETVDAAKREHGLRAALAQVQRDAAQSAAELARAQAERDRALQSEFVTLRNMHADELADAAKRERDLRAELEQVQREAARSTAELTRVQVEREGVLQSELVALRKTHASETAVATKRELDLRIELEQVQREAARATTELTRARVEREGALNVELLAKRHEIDAANNQIEAARQLEISLRVELDRRSHHLTQTLADIEQMKHTLSWRFTAPFRQFGKWSTDGGDDAAKRRAVFQSSSHASLPKLQSTALATDSAAASSVEFHQTHPPEAVHVPISPTVNHSTREQQTMNPIQSAGKLLELDDLPFVVASYRTLLGREPDSDGMHRYLECLRNGYGKENIFAEIANSPEAKAHQTQLHTSSVSESQPTMQPIQSVAALLELDDLPFVAASYVTLLGREADAEGTRHYLGCLRDGYGKENILAEIAKSPEATARAMALPGIRELVATQQKINRPIRGIVSRTGRVERQANRLENQFWSLTARVAAMEEALDNLRDTFRREIRGTHLEEAQASLAKSEYTEPNAAEARVSQRMTYAEQELPQTTRRDSRESTVIDGFQTPLEAESRHLVKR